MAANVPVSSNTLEGQTLETVKALADAEAALDPPQSRASINMNENNGTVSLTVTLPATFTTGANGELVVAPTEYIV